MRPCRTVLVLLLLAGACSAQPTLDWPQLGRDPQRSNYTPEPVGGYYNLGQWENRWLVQLDVPISQHATPVLADGLVAIGDFAGVMHGIDHATGQVRWTFQADGPIDHAAAIADGRVFFTSSDWNIYCLSAETGELLWQYATGRGCVVAPLLVDGRVYVGSKDGWFYCIDAATGELIWRTDVGEPIDVSAAYSEQAGLIFTGTVGMNAVAIDTEGEIRWRRRLQGQNLRGAWPQVGEQWGVVIYRVLPAHIMWENINSVGGSFQNLFTEEEQQRVHFVPWDDPPAGKVHHGDYVREHWSFDEFQDRIQSYLEANPSYRTCFALDVETGEDRYDRPLPILYTWGVSQTMHAQAIDTIHGRAWAIWRGWGMITENAGMPDLGGIDLENGRMVLLPVPINTPDVQPGLKGGDEHTPIAAAGDTVFHGQNRGPGGWSFVRRVESDRYPEGYYHPTFKVMGHRWRSSETAGMGPQGQPALDPTFIRTDSPPIWTHGTLIFQVGAGVTCWQPPTNSNGQEQ